MFREQESENRFVSAVERVADSLERIASGHVAPQSQSQEPRPDFLHILQLVKVPNQFINAIKEFRQLTGASLRESKEICEFLRERRFQ